MIRRWVNVALFFFGAVVQLSTGGQSGQGVQHRRVVHTGRRLGELSAAVAPAGRARLRLPALRVARDAQETPLRQRRRPLPQSARRSRQKHGRLEGTTTSRRRVQEEQLCGWCRQLLDMLARALNFALDPFCF